MSVILAEPKIGLSDSDKATMSNNIKAAVNANVASDYSTSATYEVGDLVLKDGSLYRCKTAITTAESWTAAHWEAKKIGGIVADFDKDKLSKGGFDGTTGVGYSLVSKSLETTLGNTDETPFAFETAGGSSDIETGMQSLKKLVGVDLVKNQLFNPSDFAGTSTVNGITFTKNSNGSYTISGTLTDTTAVFSFIQLSAKIPTILNNYYFIMMEGYKGTSGLALYSNTYGYGTFNKFADVFKATNAGQTWWNLRFSGEIGATINETIFPRIVRLDQRYGSAAVVNAIIGNDSSKQVANLLAFDPSILKDLSYDAGTLVPSKTAKLKTVDYNQFDIERLLNASGWSKSGDVYSGDVSNLVSYFNTNKIIEIPSNYTGRIGVFIKCKSGSGSANVRIKFNYADGTNGRTSYYNATSLTEYSDVSAENKVVASIVFDYSSSITFYIEKLCIFLYWDGSRIGYEDYDEHIVELPNIVQHGILTVVDGKVVADGDEAYPDGTGKQKRGTYTFTGSENITVFSTGTYPVYQMPLAGAKNCNSGADVFNAFGYKTASLDANTDKSPAFEIYNNVLYIQPPSSITSASDLKSFLAGKSIIYPLATPTDITTPAFPENVYMDDFGTAQFLDENGNELAGLQGAEIFYKANVAGFAESLYDRTNGVPSDVVIQSELEVVDDKHDDLYEIMQANVGGILRHQLAEANSLDFADTAWVDLGDCTWTANANAGVFYTVISDSKSISSGEVSNVLCPKYKSINSTLASSMTDKTIMASGEHTVWFKDTAYTGYTASQVKAALSGILIGYEKASS